MKRIAAWFLLLNKRLYKKATFLCMLLLIPVLVGAFQVAAQQPSGVVTVVLACREPQDALCAEIIEELRSETRIISFIEDSPQNALTAVAAGKADAAWIFPEDMAGCIREFVSGDMESEGFIRVIERETTVVLGLARERLSGAVFEKAVREAYLSSVRELAPEAQERTDRELLDYLYNANVTGQLFEYYDIYGNRKTETANYLTAPLRGLLAILVAVGSMVTAMYYQKDKENGIFSLLPEQFLPLGELGYQLISSLNMMAVVLLSLMFSGLSVSIWSELLLLFLYSICCGVFGMVLRSVFGGGKVLGACLPVMILLMLVICPVFFDIAAMQKLQLLLPPTYYITGAYNYNYLCYMLLYIGAMGLLYAAVTAGKRIFSCK